jgi:hypothetical protein
MKTELDRGFEEVCRATNQFSKREEEYYGEKESPGD